MWDTVETNSQHLSHDMPCPHCGHAPHTFLACSDSCDCEPTSRSAASPVSSGRAGSMTSSR
jgi:hypothetical protein